MSKRTKSVRIRKYQVTPYQQTALRSLMPPEDLTVSQWAEHYRVLDSKAAALPGPWRNEKTPYLVAIMDELLNYETEARKRRTPYRWPGSGQRPFTIEKSL